MSAIGALYVSIAAPYSGKTCYYAFILEKSRKKINWSYQYLKIKPDYLTLLWLLRINKIEVISRPINLIEITGSDTKINLKIAVEREFSRKIRREKENNIEVKEKWRSGRDSNPRPPA